MRKQAKDSLENATARPWSINKNGLEILARTEIGLIPVANLNFGMNPAEDASLIVRAVNSHDALVEALERSNQHNLHSRGLVNPDTAAYAVLTDVIKQNANALKLAKGE